MCPYLMQISSSVKLKSTLSGLAQSINIQLLRISETFCNSSLLKEGWERFTNLQNFEYTKISVQQWSILKYPGYQRFFLLFARFTIKTWMETYKWKVSGTPGMDWPPSFKNQSSLESYADLKNIRIIQYYFRSKKVHLVFILGACQCYWGGDQILLGTPATCM